MRNSESSESPSKSNGKPPCNGSYSSSRSSSTDSVFSDAVSYMSMPSPPDGGYGWMIILSAFMINMISDGVSFSFGILYIELLDYFGESKSLTSWIGSIFYGSCLIGGPLASALATKFGCRKVAMVGGFVASLGCFVSAFADSVGVLCLTLGVITGLAMSMGYVTSLVMVAFYFENKRALATGLAVCGSGFGTFVLAPFTEYLINLYGWRGTVIIWSGIILNLVVCGSLLRPLEFTPQERRQRALQRFERLSRTVSYTSFSTTLMSRHTSHTDELDSEEERETTDALEHCHSQIQIPTFIKDKKIPIPIELLKEAKLNKSILTKYIKNYCEENEDQRKTLPKAATSVALKKDEQVVTILRPSVKTEDTNEMKPKGSCLKKSLTTPVGTKETANTVSKQPTKPKHVHMSTYLPLYRKDIFFRGNLARLAMPAGQVKSTSCPELYKSRWDDSDSESSDEEWEAGCWRYLHFSKHVKRVLKTMFDPSILLHPLYVVFAISNFILYFWYDIPYIFMADRAKELGISEASSSYLISILGIVNTLGQIFYGFLGDLDINLSLLYGFSLMACGVVVLLVPLFTTFIPLAILSGAFGLFISVNYALSTVILVEFLGLDKLSNAYGLTMLIQGIANLLGPPVAASLYDMSKSYDMTFYAGGGFIIVSGLMLLFVPVLRHFCCKLSLDWKTRACTSYNTYHVTDTYSEEKMASIQETACSTLLVESRETPAVVPVCQDGLDDMAAVSLSHNHDTYV